MLLITNTIIKIWSINNHVYPPPQCQNNVREESFVSVHSVWGLQPQLFGSIASGPVPCKIEHLCGKWWSKGVDLRVEWGRCKAIIWTLVTDSSQTPTFSQLIRRLIIQWINKSVGEVEALMIQSLKELVSWQWRLEHMSLLLLICDLNCYNYL